jgi:DNA-binding NarL/FixJ family response regulator
MLAGQHGWFARQRARFVTPIRADPDDETGGPRHTAHVPLNLVIVDDHADFRGVARTILEGPWLDVVGEAFDARDAVEMCASLRPDVVLVDVHLPDADGFELARLLADLDPSPDVVLTSSRPLADLRSRLGRAPTRGFLTKSDLSVDAIMELLRR